MLPISMHMVNFGPYEDSTINFNFKSALIVGELSNAAEASNGTGKSTVFQAMTWVLTGNSRYKDSTRIIRHGADAASVALTFLANGQRYRIIRKRKRVGAQVVDFVKVLDDGSVEHIKCDTNSERDEKIAQVTKVRYDSFLNTVYFAQNSVSEFMYGTSSVRQKLVAEILAMDRWNSHAKKADSKLKEVEKELDSVRYRLSQLGDIPEKIKSLNAKMELINDELDELRPNLEQAQSEVERLVVLVATESESKKFAEMRDKLQRQLDSAKSESQQLSFKIETSKKKIATLKDRADRPLPADIGERPNKSSKDRDKLTSLLSQKEFLEQQLKATENGECSSCGWVWGEAHASHIEEKKKKVEQINERVTVGRQFLNKALAEEKEWDAKKQKFDSETKDIESAKVALSSEERVLSSLLEQNDSLSERISHIEEQLFSVPQVAASDSGDQLRRARSNIEIIKKLVTEKERESVGVGIELKKADESVGVHTQLVITQQSLEKEFKLYSALSRHFGKAGIQAHILDTIVYELELLSNKFLSKLSHKPFSVSFVTHKTDSKGQTKEVFDIEVLAPQGVMSIEDLSGGEQFRVAFSVRLALATIQARRLGGELQMLLLDEVSSCLDKRGLETFVSIIRELEKSMVVMVITHDDSLKEHFHNVIKVRHNGMTAAIEQVG